MSKYDIPDSVFSTEDVDENATLNFAKILSHLQKKHFEFTLKLENEKKRKKKLEGDVEKSRAEMRLMQTRTRNGNIAKDNHGIQSKLLQLSEKKLDAEKMKLSIAKAENVQMHLRINELRKEKLLQLEITRETERELAKIKNQVKKLHEEVQSAQTQKETLEKTILKAKIDFANERKKHSNLLSTARKNIHESHEMILKSIQEKLQDYLHQMQENEMKTNNSNKEQDNRYLSISFNQEDLIGINNNNEDNNTHGNTERVAILSSSPVVNRNRTISPNNGITNTSIMQDTSDTVSEPESDHSFASTTYNNHHHPHSHRSRKLSTTTRFNTTTSHSNSNGNNNNSNNNHVMEEEKMNLYTLIQDKSIELDHLRNENHKIEAHIKEKENEIAFLQDEYILKEDHITQEIADIEVALKGCEEIYREDMEILHNVSTPLQRLLHHVTLQNSAIDQQVSIVGITENNIQEYLSTFEQRLDALLHLYYALKKEPIASSELLKNQKLKKNKSGAKSVKIRGIPNMTDTDTTHNTSEGGTKQISSTSVKRRSSVKMMIPDSTSTTTTRTSMVGASTISGGQGGYHTTEPDIPVIENISKLSTHRRLTLREARLSIKLNQQEMEQILKQLDSPEQVTEKKNDSNVDQEDNDERGGDDERNNKVVKVEQGDDDDDFNNNNYPDTESEVSACNSRSHQSSSNSIKHIPKSDIERSLTDEASNSISKSITNNSHNNDREKLKSSISNSSSIPIPNEDNNDDEEYDDEDFVDS